jgi:hypothetical protein
MKTNDTPPLADDPEANHAAGAGCVTRLVRLLGFWGTPPLAPKIPPPPPPPMRPRDTASLPKSAYLNDMMAFAGLLAACNVVHEAAVYEPEDYDGEITLRRIAEAHRRLVEDCNHSLPNK